MDLAVPIPLNLPLHLLAWALDLSCCRRSYVDGSVYLCDSTLQQNPGEDDHRRLARFCYHVKVFMVVDSLQENDATAKALGLGALVSFSLLASRTLEGVSHSGDLYGPASALYGRCERGAEKIKMLWLCVKDLPTALRPSTG